MKSTILCLTFCVLYLGAGAQMHTGRQASRRGRQIGQQTPNTRQNLPGTPTARRPPNAGQGATTGTTQCDPANCVCHGELGCFRKRNHCMEGKAPLPESPAKIGTRFLLYKRGNRGIQRLTSQMPATALYAAGYDARRSTIIAIHGWTQSPTAFDGLKNVLLKKGDFNVILVDWEKGAGITGRWPLAYTQPVQNTRVVGKQVAMLVSHLAVQTGIRLGTVHLIGASLGAQVAGYAGMYLNGTVGRISGLDPSKPNFEGQPADCKLESSDAQFVDVLHTNMDVAGVAESIGHVDFFPNGGRTQPGCNSPICSHLRAKSYFRASVWTDCQFQTTRCDGAPCGPKGCPPMGFNAFNPMQVSRKGNYCITTTDKPPYCTDVKNNKPGYPGKVNPGLPGGNKPSRGNNPSVGTSNGRTTWFNNGKPLNPGVQTAWKNPNPGQQGATTVNHAGNMHKFKKVEFGLHNDGVRQQITFSLVFTMLFASLLANLL